MLVFSKIASLSVYSFRLHGRSIRAYLSGYGPELKHAVFGLITVKFVEGMEGRI